VPPASVAEYLRPQGRFALLPEAEATAVQQRADERWDELLQRAERVSELRAYPEIAERLLATVGVDDCPGCD
jgi:hypothetical protein